MSVPSFILDPTNLSMTSVHLHTETSCAAGRHNIPPPLQVDLLTLKVVSKSGLTWATSVPILVFLGLSVFDLGQMYTADRQTDVRRASSLNAPYPMGGGIIISLIYLRCS